MGFTDLGPERRRASLRTQPCPPAAPAQVAAAASRPLPGRALMAPHRGGHGGEDRVGTVDRLGVPVDDGDDDLRHVDAAEHAERADGQVVDLTRGVDRERLGGDPAQRHVGRADGVGAQRRPRRAGRPQATRTWMVPSGATEASARPPSGPDGDRRALRRGERGQQHRRLGPPGAAERGRGGRADDVHLLDLQAGGHRPRWRRRCPGVRATRTTPVPSARTPAAMGGRLGPRRTQSSRDSSTRTGRPWRSASSRAAPGPTTRRLAPKAPPLASGVAGVPPGSHHEASVSR